MKFECEQRPMPGNKLDESGQPQNSIPPLTLFPPVRNSPQEGTEVTEANAGKQA